MDPETAQEIIEAPKTRTSDVHELLELSEATLNKEARTVEVTLIQAGWSRNNRYYPSDVIAAAAPLFEGVKAYANHPTKSEQKDRPERSILDATGIYEGVRFEGGKLRATYRPIGRLGDDTWPWIVESVEGKSKPMGLSIHALGQARKGEIEGKSGVIVEAITHAHSVDIVTEPAAGGGFDRLMASDDSWTAAVLESISKEELREARPELVEEFKREWITTRDSQAIRDARAEAEQAKQQAATLTEEHRTTQAALEEAQRQVATLNKEKLVDRLLAKLPDEVREELHGKLMAAADVEAMQEVVTTSMAVLAAVRLPVRVHGAGRAASPQQAVTPYQPGNPIAEALGVSLAATQAETLNEFLEAQNQK